MQKLTAAVIGLGRIGQGYDYDQQSDQVIVTHAAAYAKHPGYQLVAAVDPDPSQRSRFESKFDRPAYADLNSMMNHQQPDVLSLAVPAESHPAVFKDMIRYHPRAILCEKPIALTSEEGRQMQFLAEKKGFTLVVNYMRRFEPGAVALGRIVRTKEIGTIFKGVAWYSKGLYNNGSHFIDLLRFWLGEVTCVEVMRRGRLWNETDPEPDVCLHFDGIPVYLLAGREEHFSIGGIDLYATAGMVQYADSGHRIVVR
ncbi:MAG: Gfo/Idh/MocA family oxidoreductase, partial [Syntrophales bacterium]|nr:Gfo/Idh/MocA family oxidoreductase [Syntrophales bacterium]